MPQQAIEGLWTAEFGSSVGMFGGGVAVFQGGVVLGGDGQYYYIGKYNVEGSSFRATLNISPFIDGAESVFKTVGRNFTLELTGSIEDNHHAIGHGTARDLPGIKFAVKLIKRS